MKLYTQIQNQVAKAIFRKNYKVRGITFSFIKLGIDIKANT